jgi:hypothetical protein
MTAGARGWGPPGANPIGANDNGAGVSTDCGDKRFHVRGRSLVIHALRNGFLLVLFAGAVDRAAARAARPRATGRSCVSPPCVPTVAADHVAGSGGAAAAKLGRSHEPVTRAMNTPSAAVTAMASCHRRVTPTPRKTTVHRMYRAKIGEWFPRAVNSIRVRCVFAQVVRLSPPCSAIGPAGIDELVEVGDAVNAVDVAE